MGDDALDQYEMRQFLGQDNHKGLQIQTSAPSSCSSSSVSAVGSFLENNKKNKKSATSTANVNTLNDMELIKGQNKKSTTPSKGFGSK